MAALLTGDRAAAEDVVQDAFVAMTGRWRRWTDEREALSYLRACVLNGVRSRGRRLALARRVPDGPAPVEHRAAEDVAIDRWCDAQLAALVRTLPTRQREVVILWFFAELTVSEAALQLGISETAVKSSAFRALQTLAARTKGQDWR